MEPWADGGACCCSACAGFSHRSTRITRTEKMCASPTFSCRVCIALGPKKLRARRSKCSGEASAPCHPPFCCWPRHSRQPTLTHPRSRRGIATRLMAAPPLHHSIPRRHLLQPHIAIHRCCPITMRRTSLVHHGMIVLRRNLCASSPLFLKVTRPISQNIWNNSPARFSAANGSRSSPRLMTSRDRRFRR